MQEVQLTTAPPLFFEAHNRSNCAYCDEALRDIQRDFVPHAAGSGDYFRYLHNLESAQRPPQDFRSLTSLAHSSLIERIVRVCPTCGWWIAFEETMHREDTGIVVNSYGGVGGLVAFDVADVTAPIREVRSYLVAKYETRFDVGPQLFEETVASVFADIGYRTRVTAYSGDDGIDVVLDGPNDQRVGVQVKRYRNRISVEQLRALTGALVVNG